MVLSMLSLRPTIDAFRKAIRRPLPDLESAAVDCWEIAPEEMRYIEPAQFLPEQLNRIKDVEFGHLDDIVRHFRGGFVARHEPTLAFRLKNVDLVDGVLYAPGAVRHLKQRQTKLPIYIV